MTLSPRRASRRFLDNPARGFIPETGGIRAA
jgi:hypothetical protein